MTTDKYSVSIRLATCLALACVCETSATLASELDDFAALEDLMNTEVVSTSKFKQNVKDTPASIYIISAQDIKRSGALTLPELLYQVPGLHVAQANTSNYSISARGFNGVYANKLLVMVDGRSLYSPLFNGVYWNAIDINLADIEQIEIIRGPGSSVWGANAVNGVINIITKGVLSHDQESLNLTYGDQFRAVSAHVGSRIAENVNQSTTVNYREHFELNYQQALDENWYNASLLSKWAYNSAKDHVEANIDFSKQNLDDPLLKPYNDAGLSNQVSNTNRYFSLNWEHLFSPSKRINSRLDTGSYKRESLGYFLKDSMLNLEFDGQFEFDQNKLTFGVSYRDHSLDLDGLQTFRLSGETDNHTVQIKSLYVSDQYQLSNRADLHFGLKYERFKHDHHEIGNIKGSVTLPTARFNYQLTDNQYLWFSWSRSARLPSIAEHTVTLDADAIPAFSVENPSPWPVVLRITPNQSFKEETNTTIEFGWRAQFSKNDWLDLVGFRSNNENIRGNVATAPYCESNNQPVPNCGFPDQIIQPAQFVNAGNVDVNGLEISYRNNLTTDHSITLNFAYMTVDTKTKNPQYSFDSSISSIPKYKWDIIYNWTLSDQWQLYTYLRSVKMAELGSSNNVITRDSVIDDYTALNTTLTYQASSNLYLSAGLKNLFHQDDLEWYDEYPAGQAGMIQRSTFIAMTYSW